jgi:peptide deformylase
VPDDFIRQWGDPVLYERADAITVFDDLLRQRLFAFRLTREHATDVIVNPRVVWRSETVATFLEGCLSFNTMAVPVRRPFAVRVEGCDVFGNPVGFDCEDFAASLMQHEIDHLDGVLTLHRADRVERRRAITTLLCSAHDEASLAA